MHPISTGRLRPFDRLPLSIRLAVEADIELSMGHTPAAEHLSRRADEMRQAEDRRAGR